MKLIPTLETIRYKNYKKVWVTTCLCDGFALTEDDVTVRSTIEDYLKNLNYKVKGAQEPDEEYFSAVDLAVNHIQGVWEATIVTSDRLYLRMLQFNPGK